MDRNHDCYENDTCLNSVGEMAGLSAAPFTQALAQLADQGNDPIAMGLAEGACGGRDTPAACRTITVERWAALEPDNGEAWLRAASAAARARRAQRAAAREATAPR